LPETQLTRRLRCGAATLALIGLAGCAAPGPRRIEPPWLQRAFRVGVYLGGQAPTERVFAELGAAGVDFVWLNQANYRRMAEHEDLHARAARHRIGIYVQLFAQLEADEPDELARTRIRDLVRFVERQRHSHVVVGYGVADEPELNYPMDQHPQVAARAQRFADLVKSIDPRRCTLTTHYGPRWHDFDTDEVWPNVFGATPERAASLTAAWRLARQHGFHSFVALAWGRPPEEAVAAPASSDPRQHYIYAYAMAAYLAGADGVVFYIFDGPPNDRDWSLVDANLQDIDGKWAALRAAIADVQQSGH